MWKRVTAGPTRALAVSLLVVLTTLSAGWSAAASGSGGEGPAPAGVWPLPPGPDEVVHGFDPPSCTWCAGHRGVDLAGTVDAPVRAVFVGRISYAGPLAGRDLVVVDNGTERTEYEPVVPVVRVGETVVAGQTIGRLAVVGGHCLPAACLHLGLIRDADDAYLDPLTLFGAAPRPVRLLPLWTPAPASAPARVLPPATLPPLVRWQLFRVLAQARGCACW